MQQAAPDTDNRSGAIKMVDDPADWDAVVASVWIPVEALPMTIPQELPNLLTLGGPELNELGLRWWPAEILGASDR
jgi:hypothetical protein